MAKDTPSIRFPVVRSFQVENYQLFPGRNGEGLSQAFGPGVTVIIGINGLGKTTLLNLLLRMLVGPFDPKKSGPLQFGSKDHELVGWKDPSYFSSRVGDEAASAVMSATIAFGDDEIRIKRRISDLEIEELWRGGEQLEPDEDKYRDVVLDASGIADRYDFDFVVRHLVFFLEERIPIVWNEQNQVELFRVLLCEGKFAAELSALFDDIKDLDSQHRNLRWHYNNRKKEITAQQVAGLKPATVDELMAKVQALEALEAKANDYESEIDRQREKRAKLQIKVQQQKLELEEKVRAHQGLQQAYLASKFPHLPAVANYVFTNLLASGGCLICGNRKADAAVRFQRLIDQGNCPVCESPPEDHEKPTSRGQASAKDVERSSQEIQSQRRDIASLEGELEKLEASLHELYSAQATTQGKIYQLASDVKLLRAQLAPSDATTKVEDYLSGMEKELNKQEAELKKKRGVYERHLRVVRKRAEATASKIKRHFETYAGSFLAEKCTISFTQFRSMVGQAGPVFEYPCFQVLMTSAVSPIRPTVRTEITDVSESQKELIDLAFRMALISTIGSKGQGAMLVLETPEASLDSIFVIEAGKLLRQFAASGNGTNRLIASSNLNNEKMIPALLGLVPVKGPKTKAAEVRKRVINLLQIAKPNAAYKKNKNKYNKMLIAATDGALE